MKAHRQQSNASGTGANTKSGCDKMQSLKASAHINKSSGNMAAKRRKGADFSPFESHTESKIASKAGGLMEAPSRDAKMLSARPPNHSGKIKLQLFPIDETIQEIMQKEKHNPYLELTLAPRKKMSSIVQHLNTKWGSSQCAKGELMLFPNDTRLDTVGGSAKWILEDSCTAADVHVTVGSPSTFRLRYGWFGPELKQQSSESSLASAHSTDKTIGSKPPDLVFNEQKHMAGSGEFPNNFVTPSVVNNTNTSQVADNPSKVAPLSWLDSISNISFGALLSEAAPSQDSKQPPSQNNTCLQQIPVTCDSFDAAIASLIARQQPSNQPKVLNPSLWEAEETCHAFPFQNQTSQASSSVPGNSIATMSSSVLCAIPETGTDDQQCATDGRKEELNGQTSVLGDDINAKPDISMHESVGDPEPGASCPRLLSGTDSIGLSSLLTDSLDAFQKFSVF
ncbi:TSL-kinase interacting protein 1-like [Miscanthus floridulus]|uniref:TSL-kinase interacting protein 1-like n=1 Tax=Miscanthus floridulus TaxID=154761 RepID=UPI0034587B2A